MYFETICYFLLNESFTFIDWTNVQRSIEMIESCNQSRSPMLSCYYDFHERKERKKDGTVKWPFGNVRSFWNSRSLSQSSVTAIRVISHCRNVPFTTIILILNAQSVPSGTFLVKRLLEILPMKFLENVQRDRDLTIVDYSTPMARRKLVYRELHFFFFFNRISFFLLKIVLLSQCAFQQIDDISPL